MSFSGKNFALCLIFVLVSGLFVCVFVGGCSGVSLENAVHVKNEKELKDAINNTPIGGSTTIALDNDITLIDSALTIPLNKNITLTSDKLEGFWKLIGVASQNTIDVLGKLTLDGISVTHENGYTGSGVYVGFGGTLRMYSGKILDNQVPGARDGGGVYNDGTFVMSGGLITNNTAGCYGGGVSSWGGSFVMLGGEISGNTAIDRGGGVYHGNGVFTMSGGKISNNWASFSGGGVHSRVDIFTMSGGEISGNTADRWGGGVFNQDGVFTMSGGEIFGNTAKSGGGVFNAGNFTMLGGKISKNIVHGPSSCVSGEGFGGGVSNWEGTVELLGGKISGNTASNGGGNVYNLGDVYYFGVRDITLLCVGVAVVVVGIVVAVLLFTVKKELKTAKGTNGASLIV